MKIELQNRNLCNSAIPIARKRFQNASGSFLITGGGECGNVTPA